MQSISQSLGDAIDNTQDQSPEANLWLAVLFCLVRDIEDRLMIMRDERIHMGQITSCSARAMRALLYQAKSPWVGEICDWVGVSHDRLLASIARLKKHYDLDSDTVLNQHIHSPRSMRRSRAT